MKVDSNVILRSGNKMPILGLGTWELDNPAEAIVSALELGYRMIDTSGDYGTQPGIAEGIKISGVKRDQFYLVTKIEETDDAYQATLKNLTELQTGYADLLLIHRPPKRGAGEELWRGLIQARDEGYVRDIGVSNYNEEQIEALVDDSGVIPVVNQIEWSPFGNSQEMLAFCDQYDIIIQAYSPLTRSGRLHDSTLEQIADHYNKTPAQIIVRWNLQMGIIPIIKAGNPDHQAENIDVFDFEISPDDMDELNSLNEQYSSLGSLAYV